MDSKNLTESNETVTVVSISPSGVSKNITTSYLGVVVNNAPRVNNVVINIPWNSTYQFNENDILDVYEDQESNEPALLKVIDLPNAGLLKFNNIPIIIGQLINVINLDQLTYTPAIGGFGLGYGIIVACVNDFGLAPNPYSVPFTISFNVLKSTPPSINNSNVYGIEAIEQSEAVNFYSIDPFTVDYQDNQNGSPYQIKIITLPINGFLDFNGNIVIEGQLILLSDIDSLKYVYSQEIIGRPCDSFDFSLSNDININLFSDPRTVFININDRPTSQSDEIIVDINNQHTFTKDYFENLFEDPTDQLKYIKLISLPTTGNIRLSGVNVTLGQEIDLDQLNINPLIYIPSYSAGPTEVEFEFTLGDDYPFITAWSEVSTILIKVTL